MTIRKLKFGVVGCGHIAQESHIPPLLKNKKVSLMAVCDENAELARRVAAGFGIPGHYTDLGNMLQAEKPDVVHVCVPPRVHAAVSIQALEAGCHVLVEKPMALTVDECDRMMAAAQKNGVRLGVVHDRLFEPVVMKARSMISSGKIGTVTGVNIEYSRQRDDYLIIDGAHWSHQMPAGAYSEELPHIIYLTREFLGGVEPVAVYAYKTSGSHSWIVADEIGMILKGRNGIATVTSSCNRPKPIGMLNIFGTKTHLHIDIYNSILIKHNGGSSRPARAIGNISQSLQRLANIGSVAMKVILGRHYTGHYTLIGKFVESILNNVDLPVTAQDGREVTAVFERIASQISRDLQETH
jgi:predicted dehydrogenase